MINGGLKYLKYCIKIEKTTINFLSSARREYICKKWLPFEIVLGFWNFSAMLQNVCFDKLNVFRLCKIVYACHMFLYLYLSLLFFKNKQIAKKKKKKWKRRIPIKTDVNDNNRFVTVKIVCSMHDTRRVQWYDNLPDWH